ncbi:MAG: hypothetical protein COB29_01105 [Sulfitobacter sp.]|nr:MAG: hypothetical protein COB29_01105 [Sulfitobacter sp.]
MTSQVKKFFEFLSRYNLWLHSPSGTGHTVPQLDDKHLIFFAGWLATQQDFNSHSSISHYVSAVRQWATHNGRDDPGNDERTNRTSFRLVKFMKALKRKFAGKKTKREPLTLVQFDTIIRMIDSGLVVDGLSRVNMHAAVTLAFMAMLRISEYTHSVLENGVLTGILRQNVEFFPSMKNPEGIRLKIDRSKTDQFRVGHILTIYASGHAHLCPVKALRTLFMQDPRPPTAPLFHFKHEDASRYAFTSTFDKILTACKLPKEKVKPHSLRSGGASAYLQTGTDPYIVAKMGRWASFCFTMYTWASDDHLRSASKTLAFGNRESRPVNLEPLRTGAYDMLAPRD